LTLRVLLGKYVLLLFGKRVCLALHGNMFSHSRKRVCALHFTERCFLLFSGKKRVCLALHGKYVFSYSQGKSLSCTSRKVFSLFSGKRFVLHFTESSCSRGRGVCLALLSERCFLLFSGKRVCLTLLRGFGRDLGLFPSGRCFLLHFSERAFCDVLLGKERFACTSRKERFAVYFSEKSVLRTCGKRAFFVYFSEEHFACTSRKERLRVLLGKAVLACRIQERVSNRKHEVVIKLPVTYCYHELYG
jgi:hypothetical protein